MHPTIIQTPAEQRLLLERIRWQQYELLLATLGDDFPALRLSYLEGRLEIMTTLGVEGGAVSDLPFV